VWYFAWILGVGFAGAFSILNAMWLELDEGKSEVHPTHRKPVRG